MINLKLLLEVVETNLTGSASGDRIHSMKDDLLIHFGAYAMSPELVEGFKELRRQRRIRLIAAGSGMTVEECVGWVIEGVDEVFVAVEAV